MKPERSTYDRALTLLGFRARSVAEMRRRLREKGAGATDVEEVIGKLVEQKLLDDADFARQFARMRITGAGASRVRILQELRRKGVAGDVAERALAELGEDEGLDPSDAIHAVAAKKWASLARLDSVTRRRRLYGFLARRGFSPDEIRRVVNALGQGAEPDDEAVELA